MLQHHDIRVLAHGVQVGRVRVGHHVALAFLQLGPAHGGVRRDLKNQIINLGFAAPVLGKGLEAHQRILLVLDHLVGAGTDRVLVNLFRGSGLQHGNRIFLGLNTGVLHGKVGQERRLGLVQHNLDGVFIHLVYRL